MAGKVTFRTERCKGCALCTTVCPKKIIHLNQHTTNSKGYFPAQIDEMQRCIGCAACAKICPDSVITVERL